MEPVLAVSAGVGVGVGVTGGSVTRKRVGGTSWALFPICPIPDWNGQEEVMIVRCEGTDLQKGGERKWYYTKIINSGGIWADTAIFVPDVHLKILRTEREWRWHFNQGNLARILFLGNAPFLFHFTVSFTIYLLGKSINRNLGDIPFLSY